MKAFIRLALCALLVLPLSSCLFKDPIFTDGFAKPDPAIAGVWMTEGEDNDPREREFAILAPIGTDAFVLHYPVAQKDGFYFEARPLKVRDRDLMQVRQIATFDDGIPKPDALTYTLIWLEPAGDGKISVRALTNEGPHTQGPADVKKAIEDPKTDWNKLFGEAQVFTRLKDK